MNVNNVTAVLPLLRLCFVASVVTVLCHCDCDVLPVLCVCVCVCVCTHVCVCVCVCVCSHACAHCVHGCVLVASWVFASGAVIVAVVPDGRVSI